MGGLFGGWGGVGRQRVCYPPPPPVVSYWRKYVHEVLVNRLGSLNLPRKSVVRLTDRPDMILDVYLGRKTTIQQRYKLEHNDSAEELMDTRKLLF